MKTKEYLKKYNLTEGWNSKVQKDFLRDITSEFLALCEVHKAEDNLKGFKNAVDAISTHWQAISNKIPFGLPESLWSYFYATVIVPARDQFCPRQMEQRRKLEEERREHKRKIEKLRQQQEKDWEEFLFKKAEEYRRRFFFFLAMTMALPVCPKESFDYLGLPVTAKEEDIMKQFRLMSIKAHPDKGGKQEDFITLVEHKNKCLSWATSNKQ